MMAQVEDKDKKISDLRGLLSQAKSKIDQYKGQLLQKEKQVQQTKKQYEKKIKLLEGDSQNIIRQYEERLLRYQKMIQEADQQVETHKKNLMLAKNTHEELTKRINNIHQVAAKIFALSPKERESSDAVEELCQIEKCKQFSQNLEGVGGGFEMETVNKLILLLLKNNQVNLNKRRQQRIQFVKRETQLSKSIEQERQRGRHLQGEIQALKKELSEVRDRHQKQIQAMAINKQKMQQQKTNQQFVKQLLIKVIMGPRDASMMALGILGKVLRFSEEELKQCEKKIK